MFVFIFNHVCLNLYSFHIFNQIELISTELTYSWFLLGDCDFENGLCTWSHVKSGDKFDWLIGKGGTNTQFTGPLADHTKGDSTGLFVVCRTLKHRLVSYDQLVTAALSS